MVRCFRGARLSIVSLCSAPRGARFPLGVPGEGVDYFSSRAQRTGEQLIYQVRGSGFLKHMVRNIVGMLLEVGKGNFRGSGFARAARGSAWTAPRGRYRALEGF